MISMSRRNSIQQEERPVQLISFSDELKLFVLVVEIWSIIVNTLKQTLVFADGFK